MYVVGGEMGSYPLHQKWDDLSFEDMILIAKQIDIILITSSANCKEQWDEKCKTLGITNTIKDYIFIPLYISHLFIQFMQQDLSALSLPILKAE